MKTLEFSQGLHLGLEEIDQQHGRFFELMNALFAADAANDNRDLVCGIIGDLADYVADHFATEEELMARFEYPDILAHQLMHIRFATHVEKFHRRYECGEIGLEHELTAFLVTWFTEHVRVEDAKYVDLFKANGM